MPGTMPNTGDTELNPTRIFPLGAQCQNYSRSVVLHLLGWGPRKHLSSHSTVFCLSPFLLLPTSACVNFAEDLRRNSK